MGKKSSDNRPWVLTRAQSPSSITIILSSGVICGGTDLDIEMGEVGKKNWRTKKSVLTEACGPGEDAWDGFLS